MRFNVEVNRHTSGWTAPSLEDKYIAQAVNYTATTSPFGVLLIGTSGRRFGAPKIRHEFVIIADLYIFAR